MSSARLPNIPSLRKQQLFLEFRSLKHAAPPGIYLSIANPTDPTCWSGVMFVRKGPYASALLRFNIKFPPTYPDLPPLVTFATDIFHPLIVPLTTYTFTTGSSNEAPVSATDEERLAPGAFSLRHGFPHWFGRAQRTANNSASGSRNVSGGVAPTNVVGDQAFEDNNVPGNKTEGDIAASDKINQGGELISSVQDSNSNQDTATRISQVPAAILNNEKDKSVHVITLLDYIRSTFDDETVLDSLPLDAAGNPGAWHAWRAHRRSGKESGSATPNRRGAPHARLPGEWNWEGVWIKRVQNGIQASQSDAALYASGASRSEAEPIRFLNLDPSAMSQVKEKLFAELDTKSS